MQQGATSACSCCNIEETRLFTSCNRSVIIIIIVITTTIVITMVALIVTIIVGDVVAGANESARPRAIIII